MKQSEISYRVPYADTDQMGVVYYANYLIYFERVRNELLREHSIPYTELEAQGVMLPVVEAYCKYISSAHYDDLLTIRGWVDQIKGVRIKIACEVLRGDERLMLGHTVHACMSPEGRLVRPPQELKIFLT